MPKPVIITPERIERELLNRGVDVFDNARLAISDSQSAVPTRRWLQGPLADAWLSVMRQLQVTYSPDIWDCDDYTRGAAFVAQLQHAWTPSRPANTGLAFGEFWYRQAAGGYHAVNSAFVYEKGNLGLVHLEPQTGKLIELTPAEIRSAKFIRF
ncbi:MAG: hypothetical protein AB9869_01110 [Verrucomicrobiia bacterium]